MYKLLTAHGFFNLARAFIGATLIIYLLNHSIPLSIIVTAKSIQLITSVIFNYPAGVIADKFGKKTSILLSCFFAILYFISMINPTNSSVIIGEVFNGLSIAFYMGAYEAWSFEFKSEKENTFSLVSRSSEILFLSSLLASVVGALYFYNSLYLSICFMLISMVIFSKTKQKIIKNEYSMIEQRESFYSTVKIFIQKSTNQTLFVILLSGLMQLIYQFWVIFFSKELGVRDENLGYVLASMMISQYFASFFTRRIKFNEFKYSKQILLILVSLLSSLVVLFFKMKLNFYMLFTIFILFVSSVSTLYNLYFSFGCSTFSDLKMESSLISILDTLSRLIGGVLLWAISLTNIESTQYIWILFAITPFIYYFISRGKV